MENSARPRPGIGENLGVFARLGRASFGSGLPGWMHREVVLKRRWMPEESFLAGIALGQVLPGPNSVKLAIHIGQQLRGVPGAAAAFLAVGVLRLPMIPVAVLLAPLGVALAWAQEARRGGRWSAAWPLSRWG